MGPLLSREDFKNSSSIFLYNYPQIFGIIYFTFFLLFEYNGIIIKIHLTGR